MNYTELIKSQFNLPELKVYLKYNPDKTEEDYLLLVQSFEKIEKMEIIKKIGNQRDFDEFQKKYPNLQQKELLDAFVATGNRLDKEIETCVEDIYII